jgi:hypothetical protein
LIVNCFGAILALFLFFLKNHRHYDSQIMQNNDRRKPSLPVDRVKNGPPEQEAGGRFSYAVI